MLMLGDQPGGTWTDEDALLALALQTYEDSLCPGCGHPRDEAYDERSVGEYEVVTYTCQGCAAREDHDRKHSGKEQGRTLGSKVAVRHLGPD